MNAADAPADPLIRRGVANDAEALARIYNHYIAHSTITFEETQVTATDMAERLAETTASELPWLVAERAGHVLGYAYTSMWKARCAYRFACEASVYLDPGVTRQRVGSALYLKLIAALRERNMHTVIGGIALPNLASIALHEAQGFKKVAHFREVGFKFERWIDVGYWQKSL